MTVLEVLNIIDTNTTLELTSSEWDELEKIMEVILKKMKKDKKDK